VRAGDLVYYYGCPDTAWAHKILGTIIATREKDPGYCVKWFDYVPEPTWYDEHEIVQVQNSSTKSLTS